MKTYLLDGCYLAAAVLFILGLKGLNAPATARRGLVFAEVGMLLAVIGTLLHGDIVQFQWILVGVVIGSARRPPRRTAEVASRSWRADGGYSRRLPEAD